jgi:transketolase
MFGIKSDLKTTKELKSVKNDKRKDKGSRRKHLQTSKLMKKMQSKQSKLMVGEKDLQTSKLMKKMQSKQSKPRVVKRRKMT